jgi:ethanolamine-phosphate cytidylyltransferase
MTDLEQETVPKPGQWPVDPQEDVPISKDRIWVDGCFDFSHHGNAHLFTVLERKYSIYFAN